MPRTVTVTVEIPDEIDAMMARYERLAYEHARQLAALGDGELTPDGEAPFHRDPERVIQGLLLVCWANAAQLFGEAGQRFEARLAAAREAGDAFASSHSSERVTLRYDRVRGVVIASGSYESVAVPLHDLLAGAAGEGV